MKFNFWQILGVALVIVGLIGVIFWKERAQPQPPVPPAPPATAPADVATQPA